MLLQVEDVAVQVRAAAEAAGLVAEAAAAPLFPGEASLAPPSRPPPRNASQQRRPRRSALRRVRLARAGRASTARGQGWLAASPLGSALSETEAMLAWEGRPIYRALLRPRR